jgi:hypothetical protein
LAGLASRRYGARLPQFVALYAGDTIWAMAMFALFALLAPRWPTARVATAALVASWLVELSQLYHAPWIDAVRDTRIGGLLLGYGFLWSDLLCYTAGVALSAVLDWEAQKFFHRRA